MPTATKPKSTHFSKKTMLIAAGVLTVAVIAWVYYRRKQSAAQPQAAYSTDVGGLPGQNYLPATGIGGASTLGQGVSAPPPPAPCPSGQIFQNGACICPDGSAPNADGTCGSGGGTPSPASTTYKHGCFDGPGPGCGGPNKHCEYWTVTDGSGQPSPPPNCIQQGSGGASSQSATVAAAPGQAGAVPGPVTSDVLSAVPSAANAPTATVAGSPTGFPKLSQPTETSDASVRMLHITQVAGRNSPSNVYEATGPRVEISPAPPPTFSALGIPSS